MISVSVIVPVYGSGYLTQCIESICRQTLHDIEIIAVCDADGTAHEILKTLAASDDRIRILYNEENKGTGYSINRGIRAARGEYIGQVDCDDTVPPDMYERLYAASDGCDIVKAGFYYIDGEKRIPEPLTSSAVECCPAELPIMQRMALFMFQPTFWSGICKTGFLRDNGLYWRETIGASFQDTSAVFKCKAEAKRVKLLPELYYEWRIHGGSTTQSKKYPYAVRGEYNDIMQYLEERPEKKKALRSVAARMRLGTYLWNAARLTGEERAEFIRQASEDFRDDAPYQYAGFYSETEKKILRIWANDPNGIITALEKRQKKGKVTPMRIRKET